MSAAVTPCRSPCNIASTFRTNPGRARRHPAAAVGPLVVVQVRTGPRVRAGRAPQGDTLPCLAQPCEAGPRSIEGLRPIADNDIALGQGRDLVGDAVGGQGRQDSQPPEYRHLIAWLEDGLRQQQRAFAPSSPPGPSYVIPAKKGLGPFIEAIMAVAKVAGDVRSALDPEVRSMDASHPFAQVQQEVDAMHLQGVGHPPPTLTSGGAPCFVRCRERPSTPLAAERREVGYPVASDRTHYLDHITIAGGERVSRWNT